jgi:hypothetical protein
MVCLKPAGETDKKGDAAEQIAAAAVVMYACRQEYTDLLLYSRSRTGRVITTYQLLLQPLAAAVLELVPQAVVCH